MTSDRTRFENKLSPEQRARLDALADESGLSWADLARLVIGQLLGRTASAALFVATNGCPQSLSDVCWFT